MSPRTKEQNEAIREQTRQQIIDAAFLEFANEGYSRTSIATVAKKAKVSKGLIYHYFGSKEEILEAIFDQLVEMGHQMTSYPDDFTARDKIKQIIEQTFDFIEHQSNVGKLMVGLAMQRDAFTALKSKLDYIQQEQMTLARKTKTTATPAPATANSSSSIGNSSSKQQQQQHQQTDT